MLYYVERDMLIVVSKQHMLSQYTLVDNKPVQIYQAKLSVGKEGLHDAIWAGDGQLAIVSADQVVRVSNLPCDDNYVLSLADVPGVLTLTSNPNPGPGARRAVQPEPWPWPQPSP